MTFKEIFAQFWADVKTAANDMWAGVKAVTKATWKIVKDAFVGFFTSLYTWFSDTISGVGKALLAFIVLLFKSLGTLVYNLLKLCFDKLIAWVQHW